MSVAGHDREMGELSNDRCVRKVRSLVYFVSVSVRAAKAAKWCGASRHLVEFSDVI